MTLKISIITPSFNQGQYLEQTIDSVLSQNYSNLEYAVIDGGSTDGSIEIIKKHEKHLTYWVSEKDRGQSHAINKGLAQVSGEVINWLNSDDYYESGSLKIIGEFFSDPSTQVLCARSNVVRDGVTLRQSTGTDIYSENLAKTIGWARIDQPETFFRRSAYQQVGLLNENLHLVMDREWLMRYLFIFGLGGIKQINKPLVNFRLHDHSKTVSKKLAFEAEHDWLFLSLAKQVGLSVPKGITFLEENSKIKIEFPMHNIELAKQAFHYFLLYKADREYFQLNLEKAAKILNQIEPEFLQEGDMELLNKLLFRSQYIPTPFIKLLRKWK